ncbi:MAG: hypothetical protein ACHQO8_06370 [Vicinamibacterales bacterium]
MRRAGLVAVGLAAAVVIVRADVLSDLGVPDSEARAQMVQSILGGTVPWVGVQVFKAAAPERRVALVRGVVAWAKAFSQTPAFLSEYQTARNQTRPDPPDQTAADPLAQQRADFDKNAAQMRAAVASQSADVKKMVEDNIKQMRAALDAMAANQEQAAAMRDAAATRNANARQQYASDLAAFDVEHPADPKAALARQLHRFVDECGTVDFAATLVPAPTDKKRMIFANDDYEHRSDQWKMCYRAGREPVQAGLTLAQAWLKELGR